MRHCGPFRLVLGQRSFDDLAGDRLPVRHVDNRDRSWLRIKRAGAQFFRSCRLHPDRQAIDARKCAVVEHNYRVVRHHCAEHHIQPAPASSGHAERVDVVGAHHGAQHLLAFDHAAQDVGLHMIRRAGTGETLQNTRVGVAGSWTSGQRVWDFQRRKDGLVGHGVSFLSVSLA